MNTYFAMRYVHDLPGQHPTLDQMPDHIELKGNPELIVRVGTQQCFYFPIENTSSSIMTIC